MKGQEAFGEFHQVVERAVSDFGLDHPELGEVTASLRLLRAKGWAKRIDLAERHRGRFDVKLSRLREVSLLFEVVDGKSVVVPSQAAGVMIGGSVRVNPLLSK